MNTTSKHKLSWIQVKLKRIKISENTFQKFDAKAIYFTFIFVLYTGKRKFKTTKHTRKNMEKDPQTYE